MPSPLAHGSLVLLARPLLGPERTDRLTRHQRWALYGMVVFALWAPDLDFLFLLLPEHPLLGHGKITHSLAAALLFTPLFVWICRGVWRIDLSMRTLAMLGFACYLSHIVMDYFTAGGGVMFAWPSSTERFASPVPLFFGAEHSQLLAWRLHLITLVTELAFVAVVWGVAIWIAQRRVVPAAPRPSHTAEAPAGGDHLLDTTEGQR